MVCFSYYGVEPFVEVYGTMNLQAYCSILDNDTFPTLWHLYGMVPCYFQDENVSCHVSEATMQ